MNVLDAVCLVLEQAGEPLHYRDITDRLLGRRLWYTRSAEPEKLLLSIITAHIREDARNARIHRVERAIYGLPGAASDFEQAAPRRAPEGLRAANVGLLADMSPYAAAAVTVLFRHPFNTPVHYADLAAGAVEEQLIPDSPRAPQRLLDELRADMNARIQFFSTGSAGSAVRLAAKGRTSFALVLTRMPDKETNRALRHKRRRDRRKASKRTRQQL